MLERRIDLLEKEKHGLIATLDVSKADAETQANPRTRSGVVQTDLSYQYLEHAEDLNSGPKRKDRLAKLKEAGNFVDESQESHQDFDAGYRTSVVHVSRNSLGFTEGQAAQQTVYMPATGGTRLNKPRRSSVAVPPGGMPAGPGGGGRTPRRSMVPTHRASMVTSATSFRTPPQSQAVDADPNGTAPQAMGRPPPARGSISSIPPPVGGRTGSLATIATGTSSQVSQQSLLQQRAVSG